MSAPTRRLRRVKQTKFGGPDAPLEEQGNCFAACVATIFGKRLSTVDRYLDGIESVKQMEAQWWERFVMWSVENLGYVPLYLPWGGKQKPEQYAWSRPGLYYIANGQSARGFGHSVVYRDGKMIHDPHPDGTGIESDESYVIFAGPHERSIGLWVSTTLSKKPATDDEEWMNAPLGTPPLGGPA